MRPLFYVLISVALLCSFSKSSSNESIDPTDRVIVDTTITFKRKGADVRVHFMNHTEPNGWNIGTIVLLPGWNYSSLDWCNKTTFCEKAKALGYNLILVDMSKSVYATKTYPQTRSDMKKYATRAWFTDTLITYCQEELDLLQEGENNFVLGLSTGGRGATLLCLDEPEIFKKGASLSGDYNQALMPKDNLMRIFYGSFSSYKQRWAGEDNVAYNLDRFRVPMYLGHGLKDKVVPVDQTLKFAQLLNDSIPGLEVRLHIDSNAVHDYKYWGSEVDRVLTFFLD